PRRPATAASTCRAIRRCWTGWRGCAPRPASSRCPRRRGRRASGSRNRLAPAEAAQWRRAGPATEGNRMFATVPNPIPARMKGLNRAEICDLNFQQFVRGWSGRAGARPADGEAILEGSALDARGFRELSAWQLISRHLDLMARVVRVQNKVFYTIGSSGHEGNAMAARLTRHTDPAFLHYRSGGFMAERFRKLPGMAPVLDSALS